MSKKYPTTSMCDGELLERFEPTARDSDVFIATSAKCGQTWLQTLLYHLKTGGQSPDFGGLGLGGVSPWLELPGDFGLTEPVDRDARLAKLEALDDPRIFKMHVVWDEIPRPQGCKAKIVTITRDPREVPYSMFSHLQAMNHKEGNAPPPTFDAYFEKWMEFGFYFKFVSGFWPHRNDPDVLWLRYEDMHTDLRLQTKRILTFLGWDISKADIDRVLPLVDFSHMQKNEKKSFIGTKGDVWKKDGKFFREGGVGKNSARLSAAQVQRILDRARADLGDDCCNFVLSLPR